MFFNFSSGKYTQYIAMEGLFEKKAVESGGFHRSDIIFNNDRFILQFQGQR
jgi:hypothetical protein